MATTERKRMTITFTNDEWETLDAIHADPDRRELLVTTACGVLRGHPLITSDVDTFSDTARVVLHLGLRQLRHAERLQRYRRAAEAMASAVDEEDLLEMGDLTADAAHGLGVK
jgi:hypothetical protein